MGWKKIVFQYNSLYCSLEARLAGTVSQYSLVCCDSQGLLGESRYKNCIVTEAAGLAGRAGHWAALVRRRGRAAGGGVAAGARRRTCWGAQGDKRAGGKQTLGARACWASGLERACGREWGRGAKQGTVGARPGSWVRGLGAGWPRLFTRCTPLGFQPGFSTRYFS